MSDLANDVSGAGYEPENEHDDEPLPAAGHRTFEVYQRERVGETTNLIKARQLISDGYLSDPYPLLGILRENYPCYRDWVGNRFWITRYDDVSSVFADDANFETRSKVSSYVRGWSGRNLWDEVSVLDARSTRINTQLQSVIERVVTDLADAPDLAKSFAVRLPLELWGAVLDLPRHDLAQFSVRYWRIQRGFGWAAAGQQDALAALEELLVYVRPLLEARRDHPGEDLISAIAQLESSDGPATAEDVVNTILEADHETLHGGLANMWFLLLTHPDHLDAVRSDPRLMKLAWLETMRHSAPVLGAPRFARHEVERFGRLIPNGGLLWCSAAAANRDPRVFDQPDHFILERTDLCQREPRGQYRADGLASGIALGLGRPSVHPAVPKDRPPSSYAITRDTAVAASRALLEAYPNVGLAPLRRPGATEPQDRRDAHLLAPAGGSMTHCCRR